MFLIEIDGVKILYTGDYSREEDRHLKPAEIPESCDVDVLIVESTYGVEKHENREVRETKFKQLVHDVVRRGLASLWEEHKSCCLFSMSIGGRIQS
jgi:cleavage and polyadenylation specificity factor subunit 3